MDVFIKAVRIIADLVVLAVMTNELKDQIEKKRMKKEHQANASS